MASLQGGAVDRTEAPEATLRAHRGAPLGHALLRFPGSGHAPRPALPCHAVPESATAGRTAHRASHPPASRDAPASGLLPGVFLRGGARVPARPEPAGPHAGLRWLVLLGHVRRRCGARGKERSRSRGRGVGAHRGAGPFPSPLRAPRCPPPACPCGKQRDRSLLRALPSLAGPLRPADPFLCKRTTDRDKWLQLETGLIDTISSVIASKIR